MTCCLSFTTRVGGGGGEGKGGGRERKGGGRGRKGEGREGGMERGGVRDK